MGPGRVPWGAQEGPAAVAAGGRAVPLQHKVRFLRVVHRGALTGSRTYTQGSPELAQDIVYWLLCLQKHQARRVCAGQDVVRAPWARDQGGERGYQQQGQLLEPASGSQQRGLGQAP